MKRLLWSVAACLGLAGLVWVMRYQPKPVMVGGKAVPGGGATATASGIATATPPGTTPAPAPTATSGPTAAPAATTPGPAATPTPPLRTPTPPPAATPTPTPSGQYRDGTYTGSSYKNAYGPVQVQVVVSGGQIASVSFLQMPSGGNSSSVTAMAEPILRQETLSAQSANVNTVSGATQDSESFRSSLASALAQA